MIPAAVIEELRARVDPVEVIGRRLELRRSGTSFTANCPFHPDKTPSFRVYPDSRRFKCFGCGARGDAFEFLQRFEGKDFKTVVRELAAEAGLAMEGERTTLVARPRVVAVASARACEAAQEHWAGRLWGPGGEPARRYLAARGVDEATARRFRLGFALNEWHDAHAALVAQGIDEAELLGAGLIRESSSKEKLAHDRFRGRVMFPFLDGTGRAVGFAGRVLPAFEGGQVPKYLNGPETSLFRKGHLLFGLHQAAAFIQKARRAVLVEGYLDALALAQSGWPETVSAGGTALTEHQLELLRRAGAEEVTVLFDTDAPGLDAPAAAATVLLHSGVSTRVARLPGTAPADPDTYLRGHGPRALAAVLDGAMPMTEWLLERAIASRTSRAPARATSVEQKLLIVRDLQPYVSAMAPGLPRALFEQRIARRLELYIVALRAELARGAGRRAGGRPWRG